MTLKKKKYGTQNTMTIKKKPWHSKYHDNLRGTQNIFRLIQDLSTGIWENSRHFETIWEELETFPDNSRGRGKFEKTWEELNTF